MLVLVLEDHVVDETAIEEWIAAIEMGVFEGLQYGLTDSTEVEIGVFAVEQVQGWTLLAGVERSIVHIVELTLGEGHAVRPLEEPQLFVVADVPVVPDQGTH